MTLIRNQSSTSVATTSTASQTTCVTSGDCYPAKDVDLESLLTVSSFDSPAVARTYYCALKQFLEPYFKSLMISRAPDGRVKPISRLNSQQFHELSTDVYDDLVRRQMDTGPCLLLCDDLHPKRNQARQKLATLPAHRFRDLSFDVYVELTRRFPEFEEEDGGELLSGPLITL